MTSPSQNGFSRLPSASLAQILGGQGLFQPGVNMMQLRNSRQDQLAGGLPRLGNTHSDQYAPSREFPHPHREIGLSWLAEPMNAGFSRRKECVNASLRIVVARDAH